MTVPSVGILHPGQMGAAVAGQLRRNDVTVMWCPAGRGDATRQRAEMARLAPAVTLTELLESCDVVLSICPPAAAEEVASGVAQARYQGVYVDANAISPARVRRVSDTVRQAGACFVDGAIVGPPPTDTIAARLYLAGERAADIAALFHRSTVEPVVLDKSIGAASGLKMAYASYQKASRTLAAVAHALAAQHDVTEHLLAEAHRNAGSPLSDPDYIPSVAARAWRWAPELMDVADTLADAGLPPQLAWATAQVLERWNRDKDQVLPLVEALDHLRDTNDTGGLQSQTEVR